MQNLVERLFSEEIDRKMNSVAIIVLLVVVGLLFLPFFTDLDNLPTSRDLAKQLNHWALFKITVADFHQLPLRSHLVGGGYPLIGHPYDCSFHPLAWLTLVMDERLVMRLNAFLLHLLGAIFIYLLSIRVFRFPWIGGLCAALFYATCTWAPEQINDGNLGKLYAHLLPVILYAATQAAQKKAWLFWGACAWFLVLVHGALAFVPFLIVLPLFFIGEGLGRGHKDVGRAFIFGIAIFAIGGLFAIGKLVPMAELYLDRIAPIHHDYETSYKLMSPDINAPTSNQLFDGLMKTPWLGGDSDWTVTFFFGWGAPLLLLLGLWFKRQRLRGHLPAVVLLVFLGMGPSFAGGVYQFFWDWLPGFQYITKTDKFILPYVVMYMAIGLGAAIPGEVSFMQGKRRWLAWVVLAVALISIGQAFRASRWFMKDNFNIATPSLDEPVDFYPVSFTDFEMMNLDFREPELAYVSKQEYLLHKHNKGTINWTNQFVLPAHSIPKYFLKAPHKKNYTPVVSTIGKPNPYYLGEAWFFEKENGASVTKISPNRIEVRVNVPESGGLVINQNFHSGWQARGFETVDVKGFLGVWIPEGYSGKVILTYRPWGHLTALAGSLVYLAGFFWLLVIRGRREDLQGSIK